MDTRLPWRSWYPMGGLRARGLGSLGAWPRPRALETNKGYKAEIWDRTRPGPKAQRFCTHAYSRTGIGPLERGTLLFCDGCCIRMRTQTPQLPFTCGHSDLMTSDFTSTWFPKSVWHTRGSTIAAESSNCNF